MLIKVIIKITVIKQQYGGTAQQTKIFDHDG